jgi:hypothetical protein
VPTRPYLARTARSRDAGGVHGRGAAGINGADGADGADRALPARGRITVQGSVERVTLAPASGSPAFEVLVRIDWYGARQDVRVIWMGQRRVPGIEAGIGLRFEGMVTRVDGIPTVYNPRYEIIGRPEDHG